MDLDTTDYHDKIKQPTIIFRYPGLDNCITQKHKEGIFLWKNFVNSD